jgi:hypothetical protein
MPACNGLFTALLTYQKFNKHFFRVLPLAVGCCQHGFTFHTYSGLVYVFLQALLGRVTATSWQRWMPAAT